MELQTINLRTNSLNPVNMTRNTQLLSQLNNDPVVLNSYHTPKTIDIKPFYELRISSYFGEGVDHTDVYKYSINTPLIMIRTSPPPTVMDEEVGIECHYAYINGLRLAHGTDYEMYTYQLSIFTPNGVRVEIFGPLSYYSLYEEPIITKLFIGASLSLLTKRHYYFKRIAAQWERRSSAESQILSKKTPTISAAYISPVENNRHVIADAIDWYINLSLSEYPELPLFVVNLDPTAPISSTCNLSSGILPGILSAFSIDEFYYSPCGKLDLNVSIQPKRDGVSPWSRNIEGSLFTHVSGGNANMPSQNVVNNSIKSDEDFQFFNSSCHSMNFMSPILNDDDNWMTWMNLVRNMANLLPTHLLNPYVIRRNQNVVNIDKTQSLPTPGLIGQIILILPPNVPSTLLPEIFKLYSVSSVVNFSQLTSELGLSSDLDVLNIPIDDFFKSNEHWSPNILFNPLGYRENLRNYFVGFRNDLLPYSFKLMCGSVNFIRYSRDGLVEYPISTSFYTLKHTAIGIIEYDGNDEVFQDSEKLSKLVQSTPLLCIGYCLEVSEETTGIEPITVGGLSAGQISSAPTTTAMTLLLPCPGPLPPNSILIVHEDFKYDNMF